MEEKKRGSFSGSIGFVLAAAGSAVGLGNLWRFPYLAAKDGGGVFLLVYIILALTFGFALMATEIAIGRKTKSSPMTAYGKISKKFGFLGVIASIIPTIIFPYYCVIGGWVTKYSVDYLIGAGMKTVADGFFGDFITGFSPILWCAVFLGISAVVVYFGVEKGIEKFSKILMPLLAFIIVGIAIFSLTLKDPVSGRNAIEGLKIYLIPDFSGMTVGRFFRITLDAMGQIFFSMSLAMGIMVTYGSYVRDDSDLVKSVNQIEIFDTAVALLAGLIMVPTVFTFQGNDGLNAAGPSLLFISLPQVFEQMGFAGHIIGALFFVLVLFAALTSSVSLLEAIVSIIMDKWNVSRQTATTLSVALSAVIALVVCLGYNVLSFGVTLPNGAENQNLLDVMDYAINSVVMPILALLTCLMVGWACKTSVITDEIKKNGEKFSREGLYNVMIKFIAPVFLFLILISGFGVFA